ncbi:hypothetical protein PMAYCL1PPCAC_15187, partial [Pristionchus mayeri]
MNIHFLYRYWSVHKPHLIPLFSRPKFIALIAMWEDEKMVGTQILRAEYERRTGKIAPEDGWIVMHFWENGKKQLDSFLALIGFDIVIFASFSIAISLCSLTFYHIKKSEKLSAQARNLQLKLFIAMCAQVSAEKHEFRRRNN